MAADSYGNELFYWSHLTITWINGRKAPLTAARIHSLIYWIAAILMCHCEGFDTPQNVKYPSFHFRFISCLFPNCINTSTRTALHIRFGFWTLNPTNQLYKLGVWLQDMQQIAHDIALEANFSLTVQNNTKMYCSIHYKCNNCVCTNTSTLAICKLLIAFNVS